MKQLYDKKSLPEMQMVEVETRLQQARSMYELSKKNMNDCALHAPFAGVVGRRTAEVGVTSMFGFISLLGMIMKNVILMYQHAEDERHLAHRSTRDAAYDAGARRMTPIFLNHRHDGRGCDPHDHRGQLVLEPRGRLHLRWWHRCADRRGHRPTRALLETLRQRGSEKADARGGRSSRNAHGVNVST